MLRMYNTATVHACYEGGWNTAEETQNMHRRRVETNGGRETHIHRYAACDTQHATRNPPHSTRDAQEMARSTLHATRRMEHAVASSSDMPQRRLGTLATLAVAIEGGCACTAMDGMRGIEGLNRAHGFASTSDRAIPTVCGDLGSCTGPAQQFLKPSLFVLLLPWRPVFVRDHPT